MKKLKRWFNEYFAPEEFNGLDTSAIADALNDSAVRGIWLNSCFEEIKRVNIEVDRRLLTGMEMGLIDLCARRKAYQDMLESVLSARRVVTQEVRHNPKADVVVNLDRVTA